MNRSANNTNGRSHCGSGAGESHGRVRLASMLRLLPTLATLALCGALAGACGRSPFEIANGSPTPTATITTSPSVGNFLYSSNFADGKVGVFTRNVNTGVLAFVGPAGAGSSNGPMGIANGPSAKFLYLANSADNDIHQYKINSTTGKLAKIGSGTVAAGSSPQWIAVTPNGQFAYAINFGDGTITPYTVNATTGALTANGSAVSSVQLKKPAAAVASNSWLYVTDTAKGTIVSFPIGGTGTLAPGTTTAISGSAVPGPVIMDPTGQFVYAADQSAGLTYYFTVGTGVLSLAASPYTTSTAGEAGLAFAANSLGNKFLYVANQLASTPSITGFQVQGNGSLSLLSGAPFTDISLGQPTGVAADPTGSFLYVANQSKGTISRFTINPTTGALGAGAPISTESASSGPLFLALGQ